MVLILIFLFVLTPYFTRRERKLSRLEALYYEGLINYQNGNISKEILVQLAQDLSTVRGLNHDSSLSMVENDLDAIAKR